MHGKICHRQILRISTADPLSSGNQRKPEDESADDEIKSLDVDDPPICSMALNASWEDHMLNDGVHAKKSKRYLINY